MGPVRDFLESTLNEGLVSAVGPSRIGALHT